MLYRYSGASSVFGSKVPNVEQWRVGSTLRGHSGGKYWGVSLWG